MSLTLTESPVIIDSGITYNLFAGFLPVEYKFKREDLQILSLGMGADNTVSILISEDLTSILSVGDSIYLYAPGDTLSYIYDTQGEILEITATTIRLDLQYIESCSSGYINYLPNYYVEAQLVHVDNSLIQMIDFSLTDDGDLAGNVIIDVSIANDKNSQYFEELSQELTDARIKFKLQYRQVYDGSSESFTLIDEEIILVYATEQMDLDEFINDFDNPEIYEGYECGIVFAHSDVNNEDTAISIYYDELDRNKYNINIDNLIIQFDADKYGFLFAYWNKDTVLDPNTEYIKFKAAYTALADYDAADYDGSDYQTT